MGDKRNFLFTRSRKAAPAQDLFVVSPENCTETDDILLRQNSPEYRIGFWKNGTDRWQSSGTVHTDDWKLFGAYDMNGDGKADIVAAGCAENGTGNVISYAGYYRNGMDTRENWVTIGSFMTPADAHWNAVIGNLTGKKNYNSIIWHSVRYGKLGAWLDGTAEWKELPGFFGKDWEIAGCGDFEGTGKESVLMSYEHGSVYYSVNLKGTLKEIKGPGAEWKVCGIGDLSGTGKADILFVHEKFGLLVKWHMGAPVKLGQIDSRAWKVLGCGRYSGGKAEDILVRSRDGIVGYYAAGNLAHWYEIGTLQDEWSIVL